MNVVHLAPHPTDADKRATAEDVTAMVGELLAYSARISDAAHTLQSLVYEALAEPDPCRADMLLSEVGQTLSEIRSAVTGDVASDASYENWLA